MPRGLGDDPLSRQRKNRNAEPHASGISASNSEAAAPPTSSVQPLVQAGPIADAESSSPQLPVSNDVFFQRKPEKGQEDTPATKDYNPGPSFSEPVVDPAGLTRIGSPSVGMNQTGSVDSPNLQGVKDTVSAEQPPVPTDLTGETEAVQPATGPQGLFKRFFGKLRQR